MPKGISQSELEARFERADKQWEKGELRSAFRLLLSAAKAGHSGSQINLGNFYSDGIGMKPNQDRAIYWYRKAYRKGYFAAASNLGCVFRDKQDLKLALLWFERGVKLGDCDAHVEIAKVHLQSNDRLNAIYHLKEALKAKERYEITEHSREVAQELLAQLQPANVRKNQRKASAAK